MSRLRILLIADTHLGFDLPQRPRVERRRRGPDFFANFDRALEPARHGEVDLVVHGGDVLFRSKVRRELVHHAFERLAEVAAGGVPVVVVPGNHERGAIPYPLLAVHADLFVLDRPQTIELDIGGTRVALAGFPFEREDVRRRFPRLLRKTGWRDSSAPIRLLCLHQTVEGARVGPSGYMFRGQPDVIRGEDIPGGFVAVLAGHIHRHQVLTRNLDGAPLAAPVLYPGSIERTSAAERDEPKGYMTLDVVASEEGGRLRRWDFHELPTRPMIDLEVRVGNLSPRRLEERLRTLFASIDPDAVVRLDIRGDPEPGARGILSAARLREIAPPTVTLTSRRQARGAKARS